MGSAATDPHRAALGAGEADLSSYDQGLRRIAQYRLCLERDTERGIVAAEAAAAVDRGFVDLAGLLESARIEVEGAGRSPHDGLARHFAAACDDLGRRLFVAACREPDARRLEATAAELTARALALVERLRLRIGRAA